MDISAAKLKQAKNYLPPYAYRMIIIRIIIIVNPNIRSGNELSATELRDGLALRYAVPLQRMPETCDGCGARMDLQHALGCMK
jgi:hypothetical protein